MKIIISPDSFKESLNAIDVADAIEVGFRSIFPDSTYIKLPVADGGEGSVDVLIRSTNGHIVSTQVTGPLGYKIDSFYGVSADRKVAYIEIAAACGIELLEEHEKNPLITTSYGVGELILHALDSQIRSFIFCIGGSATNDGGVGMLQALGVQFKDIAGNEIGFGGGQLQYINSMILNQLDPRLAECSLEIACDVNNPLLGKNGASAIFGPQKGATPEMVEQLEFGLTHYADVIQQMTGKDIVHFAGAGAAGGLGAAFKGLLNAELKSGIDLIINAIHLENELKDATFVITGEGRIDSQSIFGKVPVGVAKLAKKYHKPVIGIAGSLTDDVAVVHDHGVDAVFSSLYKVCTLEFALNNAKSSLIMASRNIAATIKIGMDISLPQ